MPRRPLAVSSALAARTRALAGACALAAVALTACGDDSGDDDGAVGTTTTTARVTTEAEVTTTTPKPPTTTAAETTTTVAGPLVVEVDVVGGEPVGGARTEQVPLGSEVRLVVAADAADELHLHGYDLLADLPPGQPVTLDFVADMAGTFELELHGSGAQLLELEVG